MFSVQWMTDTSISSRHVKGTESNCPSEFSVRAALPHCEASRLSDVRGASALGHLWC